jgi:membrane protein implicated in regulation of membrane protease activity
MDPWRVIGWLILWFGFCLAAGLISVVANGSYATGSGIAFVIGAAAGAYLIYRHYRRRKSPGGG